MARLKLIHKKLCYRCAEELADFLGCSVSDLKGQGLETVGEAECENPYPKWLEEERLKRVYGSEP